MPPPYRLGFLNISGDAPPLWTLSFWKKLKLIWARGLNTLFCESKTRFCLIFSKLASPPLKILKTPLRRNTLATYIYYTVGLYWRKYKKCGKTKGKNEREEAKDTKIVVHSRDYRRIGAELYYRFTKL